jgi:glycosyltransferase involved in cell wall biosynthesis
MDGGLVTTIIPIYNRPAMPAEAVASVLAQTYRPIEIIVDDGSSHDSAGIIRRYEPWLTYWHSRKDAGQADALRTGFSQESAEVIEPDLHTAADVRRLAAEEDARPPFVVLRVSWWNTDHFLRCIVPRCPLRFRS